ncbi:MAG: class B sortase [Lachnospiraceae bacterium]|nr:class B sortase [Lachnospiraceae bacterium]
MGKRRKELTGTGKGRKLEFARKALIILAFALLAYSCIRLGIYAYNIGKSESEVQQLKELIDGSEIMEYQDSQGESSSEDISSGDPFAALDLEEKLRAAMRAKYGSLTELNPDFAGWLTIEGTNVDYPVMYTPDDPQYYLHRAFDGSYSLSGTLFIDSRCSMDPGNIGTNTIIYGHRMSSGTMFGSFGLFYDNEDDYVREHHNVRFDTPDRPGSYIIFAVFLSQIYEEEDTDHFHYLDFIQAGSPEELEAYLAGVKELASYYDEDNEPDFGDEFLTLSTCSYHTEDGRLVLLAKRTGY